MIDVSKYDILENEEDWKMVCKTIMKEVIKWIE